MMRTVPYVCILQLPMFFVTEAFNCYTAHLRCRSCRQCPIDVVQPACEHGSISDSVYLSLTTTVIPYICIIYVL